MRQVAQYYQGMDHQTGSIGDQVGQGWPGWPRGNVHNMSNLEIRDANDLPAVLDMGRAATRFDIEAELIRLTELNAAFTHSRADMTLNGVRMGRLLVEAKPQMPHGAWLPWLAKAGVNLETARRWGGVVQIPQLVEFDDAEAADAIIEAGGLVAFLLAQKRLAAGNATAAIQPTYPAGVYATVVIDPPWPMVKIEREVRPNQAGLDYPTMSLDEIAALPVPGLLADDAWVLLWTTQKFLPHALELLETWGLGYRWTMVWHKPGGFQPYNSPQFNGEFVVVGARGNPRVLDGKAFNAVFEAPRGEHSEKPQAFYDLVGRTLGPGLEMFARSERDGWVAWGNEV